MPYRFGRATMAFGWLLILIGIVYLGIGIRDALGAVSGSVARMIVGLVAIVVGSSVVRWAMRAR